MFVLASALQLFFKALSPEWEEEQLIRAYSITGDLAPPALPLEGGGIKVIQQAQPVQQTGPTIYYAAANHTPDAALAASQPDNVVFTVGPHGRQITELPEGATFRAPLILPVSPFHVSTYAESGEYAATEELQGQPVEGENSDIQQNRTSENVAISPGGVYPDITKLTDA